MRSAVRSFAIYCAASVERIRPSHATGRLADRASRAELDGLTVAFWARTLAVLAVSVWLVFIVPWPRDAYYVSFAAAFFVFGYVPFRMRRHRHASWIKRGFVVLDVALVTVAILLPLGVQYPAQLRLRGQEYLYLLLLLAEAALTYSSATVLWTGAAILSIWSLGAGLIYHLPSTTRYRDATRNGPLSEAETVAIYFDQTFVSLTQWRTQLVATTLLTLILALAVWRSRQTLLAHVQEEVHRADLARYVSPDVADAVAAQVSDGFGEPTERIVAILYADMVGFTTATEALTPSQTFKLLQNFQARCTRIVFEHRGTLDKYLGDGFMATFGSLEDQDDVSVRAMACAFDLQAEIVHWNKKRAIRGAEPIKLSVGVNCGEVIVGNLGVDQRAEFTVVGDAVNIASRLEEATREFGAMILVSESCLSAAPAYWADRFDRAVELTPRGRVRSIRAHVVTRFA